MSPFIAEAIGSILRSLLKAAFGWLVAQGLLDPGQVESLIVGLTGFLFTVGWSLWRKYVERQGHVL